MRPDLIDSKSRQDQIKRNNAEINKIIRQKKFYLKHKPIFDTVQEEKEAGVGQDSTVEEPEDF
jgi:hypothetical protein